MKFKFALFLVASTLAVVSEADAIESVLTPFQNAQRDIIELKNDSFVDTGASAYVQMGFVRGEMAGVWVKVPDTATHFKVDFFRVLIGSGRGGEAPASRLEAFFRMGVDLSGKFAPSIPGQLQNAVALTPGPYWNDIPAIGEKGDTLPCLNGGSLVGAAIEFTHDGIPSVFRDADGMANPFANTLFAVPGGWNYSQAFGLQGDWVLRIVGHSATAAECQH